MFPLRDDNPSRTTPVVTRALIAANVIAFVLELGMGPELASLITVWGLVPMRVAAVFSGTESAAPVLATFLSSMFLHGGWVHLIGNMWYLWIFGDNVEDHFGHAGFLAFYLACGAASAALHVFIAPWSPIPTVGASGAIAGVLGAYALLYPRARVLTLVPIVFFIQIVSLPALLVLGFWFVVQFFSGTLALGGGGGGGGVAWWAHIGGFVFGMLVVLVTGRRHDSRAWVAEE
jgi:membrane associated rhomboid family serine protease